MRVAVQNGTLVRVARGVYVAAEYQDSFAARAHAALRWAGPHGALTGEGALFVWGIVEEPPAQIQVALTRGTGRSAPAWLSVVFATTSFTCVDWMSMQVACPEPALIYAFGRLPPSTRESLVFAAAHRGLISIPTMLDVLDHTPRVRARKELERLVQGIAAGNESHLELVGSERVFTTPELKSLLRQHTMRVDGKTYRADYYDPATRTAIELDGAAYHGDLAVRTRDIARDATLAAHGTLTIRFGYRDVVDRPLWCRRIVIAALQTRLAA